ncbi:hypothetical protein [Pantoea sp. At-9b]|uniref:hypothetical protein n=1 Tax=Pantoea sp. (strain At-9b) TaxID=592316 RepID=UPI000321DC6D|nr:hypothetical protein [Pantoea sp. At-9b]
MWTDIEPYAPQGFASLNFVNSRHGWHLMVPIVHCQALMQWPLRFTMVNTTLHLPGERRKVNRATARQSGLLVSDDVAEQLGLG